MKFDRTKPVIIYGPQGCGKTMNAERLSNAFGKTRIVDGWCWDRKLLPAQIALTNCPDITFSYPNVFSYGEAMKFVRKTEGRQ